MWLESRKREEGEIFRIIGRDPDSTRRSFCPPSRIVASEIRERFGGSNALKGGRREGEGEVRVSGLVRRQKLAGRKREGEGERGYGGASTWRKLGESCRRQWRRESVLRKKARRVEQRIFDENGVHGKPLKGDEWKKREWTWSPLASSLFFSRDASVSLSSPLWQIIHWGKSRSTRNERDDTNAGQGRRGEEGGEMVVDEAVWRGGSKVGTRMMFPFGPGMALWGFLFDTEMFVGKKECLIGRLGNIEDENGTVSNRDTADLQNFEWFEVLNEDDK